MLRLLRLVAFVVALALPSTVLASTIDFEGFTDGDVLTNQIADVTFSNGMVLTAGVSLNESEFPPRSGSNVVFDDGGAISIAFASPLASFAGYFTYLAPLTLEAFSTAHVSLGTVSSAFGSNVALSGDAGSSPNEFLQLAFASGVGSVTITGDLAGGSFVLDDLVLTALPTGPGSDPNVPAPEPATLILTALGLSQVRRLRRRRTSASARASC